MQQQFRPGFKAIVFGAGGGIGSAIASQLESDPRCAGVTRLGRATSPPIDLKDEETILAAAKRLTAQSPFDLMFDATGILHDGALQPEKSLADLDMEKFQSALAVNAIGPALLLKHFAPLMNKSERSVFATLSARVGSIGDNRLGGWYAYRASKAALNMIVKTASVELKRKNNNAVLLALHPGTVETPLSEPFAKNHKTVSPQAAADSLLAVVNRAKPGDTGAFLAYDGTSIPW